MSCEEASSPRIETISCLLKILNPFEGSIGTPESSINRTS